jgi:hypothetical protein
LEAADAMRTTHGVTYTRAQAAEFLLAKLDETEEVFNTVGFFPDDSRAAFDLAVASARSYYEALASTPTAVDVPAAPQWALRNVWPNPFGSEAHVEYFTPVGGGTHTVAVYDAAGRLVRTLFSGRRDGGEHRIEWDGNDAHGRRVASGVYFVRVHTPDASVARKLVLLR